MVKQLKTIVFIAATAALFLIFYALPLHTEDGIWSEFIGHWIWIHKTVPTKDLWTWSCKGQNWYAQEWGFDTLLYLLNQLGGFSLMVLFMTTISTLTWFIVAHVSNMRGFTYPRLIAFVAAVCSLPWDDYRAEVLSYLFVAIVFWMLERHRQGHRRALYWLIPLEVVWVNVHGSFLFGIGLVGIAAVIAIIPDSRIWWIDHIRDKQAAKRLFWVAALMALAALLNPRGWHIYVFSVWLSTSAHMSQYINEWHPTTFTSWYTLAVAGFGLLAIVLRLIVRQTPSLVDLAISVVVFAMYVKAVRFGSYALIALPIFASVSYTGQPSILWFGRRWQRKYMATVYAALSVGACLVAGQSLLSLHGHLMNHVDRKFNPTAMSVVENIHTEHPGWRLWNEYDLGGTLEMQGIPVAIDGRTDLYEPNRTLQNYVAIQAAQVGSYARFNQYHANYVVIYKTDPFAQLLQLSNQWDTVYSGKLYVVFVRKVAQSNV